MVQIRLTVATSTMTAPVVKKVRILFRKRFFRISSQSFMKYVYLI